jgi:hypothetical protein
MSHLFAVIIHGAVEILLSIYRRTHSIHSALEENTCIWKFWPQWAIYMICVPDRCKIGYLVAVPLELGKAATHAVISHGGKTVPCSSHSHQPYSLLCILPFSVQYWELTNITVAFNSNPTYSSEKYR